MTSSRHSIEIIDWLRQADARALDAWSRHPVGPGVDVQLDALVRRRAALHRRLEIAANGTMPDHPGREAIGAELAVVNANIMARAAAVGRRRSAE